MRPRGDVTQGATHDDDQKAFNRLLRALKQVSLNLGIAEFIVLTGSFFHAQL